MSLGKFAPENALVFQVTKAGMELPVLLVVMLCQVFVEGGANIGKLSNIEPTDLAGSPCLGYVHSEHRLGGAAIPFDDKLDHDDLKRDFKMQGRHPLSPARSVELIQRKGACCLVVYK